MMTNVADPQNAPDALLLREQIRSWRFYDHFRTDADAPARTAQIGTYTPVLGHDGADLPAALQTIREIGDRDALDRAVSDAFPGGSIFIAHDGERFALHMKQHGLLRPLGAAELSDGTLRYLLWIAALLTPRPPQLLVLNEPETSLHPELLPPLARLIAHAAESTQVLIVSHSSPLVASIAEHAECNSLRLEKALGETKIADESEHDRPPWSWPTR
jgi:predicted ATPase